MAKAYHNRPPRSPCKSMALSLRTDLVHRRGRSGARDDLPLRGLPGPVGCAVPCRRGRADRHLRPARAAQELCQGRRERQSARTGVLSRMRDAALRHGAGERHLGGHPGSAASRSARSSFLRSRSGSARACPGCRTCTGSRAHRNSRRSCLQYGEARRDRGPRQRRSPAENGREGGPAAPSSRRSAGVPSRLRPRAGGPGCLHLTQTRATIPRCAFSSVPACER